MEDILAHLEHAVALMTTNYGRFLRGGKSQFDRLLLFLDQLHVSVLQKTEPWFTAMW